jgi:hypothetical protein
MDGEEECLETDFGKFLTLFICIFFVRFRRYWGFLILRCRDPYELESSFA